MQQSVLRLSSLMFCWSNRSTVQQRIDMNGPEEEVRDEMIYFVASVRLTRDSCHPQKRVPSTYLNWRLIEAIPFPSLSSINMTREARNVLGSGTSFDFARMTPEEWHDMNFTDFVKVQSSSSSVCIVNRYIFMYCTSYTSLCHTSVIFRSSGYNYNKY